MPDPHELTVTEAARAVAAGELTSEALVAGCLARIETREPAVEAWEFLDPDLALEQARSRDREESRGPLHGVPFGVKDIFDTYDMPTAMGSPIYAGHRPRADASVVAAVRAAGAVVLGKTVTTEFAASHPGKTRNPWDPARTPAGSSSGSAAAVGDRMVPAAFGTQTAGSVIRPAAFCGTVGWKPTFGAYNRTGIKSQAESVDTIGFMTRSVEDVGLVDAVLTRRDPAAGAEPATPPRIGLARTHLWSEVDADARAAVEDAADRLAAAGAKVDEVELPPAFEGITGAHWLILAYEFARALAHELANHRDQMSDILGETLERGLAASFEDYRAARELARDSRVRLADAFRGRDVLLTMSAQGVAPEGLGWTGDYRFQSLWSVLHVPCMTLPTHTSAAGLPIGTEYVGPRGADRDLIAACRWVERTLA